MTKQMHNKTTITIGEDIRLARLSNGWSQQVLAKRLKVEASSISTWERGKGHPAAKQIVKLATFLGIFASDLAHRIVQERAAKQTKQENDHVQAH